MSSHDWSMLKNLLEYKNGDLFWKVDRGSQKVQGKKAGTKLPTGHVVVRIRELGGAIYAHRIVFYLINGYVPNMIDHVNNNPSDNRIENLRVCTRSENYMNKGAHRNSKSRIKNVYFNKRLNTWYVQLKAGGRVFYVGCLKTVEEAKAVAFALREKHHGQFANHGALV